MRLNGREKLNAGDLTIRVAQNEASELMEDVLPSEFSLGEIGFDQYPSPEYFRSNGVG